MAIPAPPTSPIGTPASTDAGADDDGHNGSSADRLQLPRAPLRPIPVRDVELHRSRYRGIELDEEYYAAGDPPQIRVPEARPWLGLKRRNSSYVSPLGASSPTEKKNPGQRLEPQKIAI